MSQETFPFADTDETPYLDEPATNRKKLLIGGGVVAALVIAAGGYFLLGSGGTGTDSAFVVPHHQARTATAPSKTIAAAKKLPAPYKAQLGRDPFKALYVAPAAAAPGAVGTAVTGSPTGVTPGGTTGTTGTSGTTGTTGTGAGSTPVTAVNQQYKLVLLRVYGTGTDRTAVFSIDGKQQVAKIGTKFGPTSELVLLSMQQGPKAGQWTTVLQVGDGDPFDVVTGTPTYVR